ncbi:MAG: hypothetical protein AAGF14_10210, partial [Pseudomonadota bacterium]
MRRNVTNFIQRLRGQSAGNGPEFDDENLPDAKDRQYLVRLLLDIEDNLPVNEIMLEGVRLWPLVRLQIGLAFKKTHLSPEPTSSSTSANQATTVRDDGFPTDAEQRKALNRTHRASLPREPDKLQALLEDQWAMLSEHAQPDFLILSKIEKYYQRVGSRRFAPVLDPVHEDLAARGKSLTVALEPLDFACVNEPVRVDVAPHMIATSKWPKVSDDQALRQMNEIQAYLRSVNSSVSISPEGVIDRFNRLRRRAAFFRQMFETLAPRAIFMSSFTGWHAAVWAARQLGIPTVDIQHGGQTAYHHTNTHFGDMPEEGYVFLPDYFWLWGDMNRDFIAKWLPGNAERHVPLVGGNRNIAKWYRDRDEGKLADADKAFLEACVDAPNLVLVTLGNTADKLLPDELLQAMGASPELNWLVRLHPNKRDADTRDVIKRELEGAGCTAFDVDAPTDVRLHTVLSVSRHHVTPFSTSGREAAAFGVPTTICHAIGAK